MKNLKRIATIAIAAIALQLIAIAPASAAGTCSVSGGVLYVVNDGGYLQMANATHDVDDYVYCSSDDESIDVDSITSRKIVVVPDLDGSAGGDELAIYLDNLELTGAVADWHGMKFDITLESDDDLEFNGTNVEDIENPLINSNKLKITVGEVRFSVEPSNLSGTFDVERPSTSELDIYGGNDNDVIDARGANFYEDQIDIDGEDGYDVVFGSDNEDDIYAEYIYPGLAEYGPEGYDNIQGSDKCDGYVCLLSFKGLTQDLEVETDYTYSGDGSRWYHLASSYISADYSVLVLGSGDDTMVIGEVVQWKKVKGGPGDDLLLGYGSSEDRLYGGPGDDVLKGFAGDDILVGNKGTDKLVGGSDYDICKAGEINVACEWVQ